MKRQPLNDVLILAGVFALVVLTLPLLAAGAFVATASGMRSFGSFHGNMLTSAFGASIAASIATAYGCAGMSSGRINTGVWHLPTTQPLPAAHAPQSTVRIVLQLSIAVRLSQAFAVEQNSMSLCGTHPAVASGR